jgi:hypothetical protein
VFIATFSNISAISWRSVLLVKETGVPGENYRPVTDKLYHIMCGGASIIFITLIQLNVIIMNMDKYFPRKTWTAKITG